LNDLENMNFIIIIKTKWSNKDFFSKFVLDYWYFLNLTSNSGTGHHNKLHVLLKV